MNPPQTAQTPPIPKGIQFLPFKGCHPLASNVKNIASPPYDVISNEQARQVIATNPLSFLKIIKPAICLPKSVSQYDPQVYEMGKKNFNSLLSSKQLVSDPTPCFYIYSQTVGDHTQYGFIGQASVEQYDKGLIKRHELTLKIKEDDRVKLLTAHSAQVGPVLLTFSATQNILNLLTNVVKKKKPYFTFSPESNSDEVHSLWIIDQAKDIQDISNSFSQLDSLYIADGHHRSAAASRYHTLHPKNENGKYFLSVAFPSNQLQIVGYHRIVSLSGSNCTKYRNNFPLLISDCEKAGFIFTKLDLSNPPSHSNISQYFPKRKNSMTIYSGNSNWYLVEFPPLDPKKMLSPDDLDVSRLSDLIFAPLFHIKDIRTDKRIKFIGGDTFETLSKLKSMVDQVSTSNEKQWDLLFLMFPVSVSELITVSDHDQLMPPKSTFFYPKLQSGVVSRLL